MRLPGWHEAVHVAMCVFVCRLVRLRAGATLRAKTLVHHASCNVVCLQVRTIEDKGLVDWALSKLDSEEKSMVFDPRWVLLNAIFILLVA
eukprot:1157968-Pelagomonas_calceolata.AAC.1